MNLRQIMTDEIKLSAWLDYDFIKDTKKSTIGQYVDYLNSLDDKTFLKHYNQVIKSENELD